MPFVGTAPIIESGSNANGSWIKYADGTMICSHRFNADLNGWSWTAVGNVYYKSVSLPGFPNNFVGNVYVDRFLDVFNGALIWDSGSTSASTTTNPGNIYLFCANNINPTNIIVGYFAIGRWK